MKLTELLNTISFFKTNKKINESEVTGIEVDSRKVQPGNIFICIKGFTVDGHKFAKDAQLKGACAIIAEHPIDLDIPVIVVNNTTKILAKLANTFYNHPSEKFRLIGITGTNGKTTLTYLLDEIFQLQNEKTGVIGTIRIKIGDEEIPTVNTTPDALVLQRTFHQMAEKEISTAIMEVSSHALDLGRVYGCDFDIAVFTNLSQDHLDYHKNMDDYFRAKSLLFAQLGNVYNNKRKYAVINGDDPHGVQLARSTPYEVLFYGLKDTNDVRAENVSLSPTGSSFDMITPVGTVQIHTPLVGTFSIYNLLAAAASAITANVPLSVIKEAFRTTKGVPGRFESVQAGQNFGIIVDYAHTPDSLQNVLQTVRSFSKGKVFVVVGCGGDRDRTKRPLMAEIGVKFADHAFFTSDNPRTEDPKQILKDMTENLTAANYTVEENRKKAIELAIEHAKKDDVIVIAGKGHETYQEIHHVRYEFDDRQIAKEIVLKQLKGNK
jgi:UDP-N-acetylmuramoyl-L-alanyl-D-glutamate--2,6-diaminopimelate ligase